MKLACVVASPDVGESPLALLSGTLEEKLARAAELGYSGVELMVRDPSAVDIDGTLRLLSLRRLEVPQVSTGCLLGRDHLALIHSDPATCRAARARVEDIIRFAGRFGSGTLVNLGRVRGRIDWLREEERASAPRRFISTFRELAELAASVSVRLALEPCNRYEVDFVLNAQDGMRVVREVAHPNFGLMLDVFHMNIEDGSIPASIRDVAPALLHVHIADSNRLPPGKGHIDFRSVVGALKSIGYEGYLSGEMSPIPNADEAARDTIEYMKDLV